MLILLKDFVQDTYTNTSGYSFYVQLKELINAGEVVEISFKDSSVTSSSFLNSSFGILIDELGLTEFKRVIRPKDLSKTQMTVLLKYVKGFENSKNAA